MTAAAAAESSLHRVVVVLLVVLWQLLPREGHEGNKCVRR